MVTVPPDWLVTGTWMTTASARALGDQLSTRGHGQAAAGPADGGIAAGTRLQGEGAVDGHGTGHVEGDAGARPVAGHRLARVGRCR